MKAPIVISLLCLMTVQAIATQQVQDKLEYQGHLYDIGGNGNFPLERYFWTCSKEVTAKWYDLFRMKNSDGKTFTVGSTACYRGHVASWSVETNTLMLTAIKITLHSKEMESVDVLKPIFGDKIRDGKIYAFWFDGHITLDGIHEILFFEKGRLVRKKVFQEHNEMYHADGDLLVAERDNNEKRKQGKTPNVDSSQ